MRCSAPAKQTARRNNRATALLAVAAGRRYRLAVMPPSTYRMCPLTKLLAALARKTAAPLSLIHISEPTRPY